ncbi:Midasin [Hypsibius exemplaris]|uniref:Midasin n=1 Tax=Hypsibius exemplaris TaxID=2072580 RepID=A0A1W0WGH8_HYPEX|nr:Midasin [Hypsibius exemplaris]
MRATGHSSPKLSPIMLDYIVPGCYEELVKSLTLYIKYDVPVLLTGPVGCGKTALLRHFAGLAGRSKIPRLITIQLCRDLDGRALLGAYHCTDVGGEFKWIPGLLTTAVLNSSWVILEDLDNAAVDALSILLPLIQSRSLQVPELGKTLQAGPDFRLFATMRTHESRNVQSHRVDMVLVSHFRRLHLEQIPTSDILSLSSSLFPQLSDILPRLLQILELTSRPELCDDPEVRRALLSRLISVRDFFKICRRLSAYVSPSSSMADGRNIFLDFFTCFCAFIPGSTAVDTTAGTASDREPPSKPTKLKLAQMLASVLGLTHSDAEIYISRLTPEIANQGDAVRIGRVTLPNRVDPSLQVEIAATTISEHPSVRRLMENIASCIASNEAALLVGETGTGKTTIIQHLADLLGRKLHVINLSHQAETSDLFGGYKPVDFRSQMSTLTESFFALFTVTFSVEKNRTFLTNCQTAFGEKNWKTLVAGMRHIADSARKRSKKTDPSDAAWLLQLNNWNAFSVNLAVVEKQLLLHQRSLIFAFLEGTLVKSFRVGDWVLLDEINLATPELLAGLHSFIDSTCRSFILSDRGDTEDIERHPDFRLFACMNPATDVGKRELPADVRSRFTEIYCDELTDLQEIRQVVEWYLRPLGLIKDESSSLPLIDAVANLHVELKGLAEKSLMDGVNHKPHYSLRTFTQALKYAAKNPMGNVRRSLYEGFSLSYLTQLNRVSQNLVKAKIGSRLLPAAELAANKFISAPKPQSGKFVKIEGYYVECGSLEPALDEKYIMTETVRSNLAEIARAVSAGRIPVLLQGETSIGKTSLITWLARASGNQCVRINNHEFTDLQDYIGSYQTNAAGKLVFVEGVLVNAVRRGFWIILDELNLAPSDVLEALNRLLDSNRELFIPEKQEVVRAHSQFMLFATQNPPGYYGGRKTLSRAFRNRFIEMHFDEIPAGELQTILHRRCAISPKDAKKIIDVMVALQNRRKTSGIFAGKQGFMTLRDLFRWAERYRLASVTADETFYDYNQHMADHGFLLLGGRVRKADELEAIRETLEKYFGRKINPDALFGKLASPTTDSILSSFISCTAPEFSHIVWTSNLKRMVALAGTALANGEAVLLVGETGCGKTTVCQIYACLKLARLFAIGCHMNTETSDFLGGLRPVRPEDSATVGSALFVWKDGPLVEAMKQGGVLLLDEVSLAADSVLERINSVLEPERQLVLTEKGCTEEDAVPEVVARADFRLVATMNPGGDFGKKELSPALRNRFTEIWCGNLEIELDLQPLLDHNLFRGTSLWENAELKSLFQRTMGEFVVWFSQQYPRIVITGRDVMSWIGFINRFLSEANDASIVFASARHPCLAYFHGTSMVFESMTVYAKEITAHYHQSQTGNSPVINFLERQLGGSSFADLITTAELSVTSMDLVNEVGHFGIHPFITARRDGAVDDQSYDFGSASVRRSLQRILRGLMVAKGVLLEGPPGVGKTSIVKAMGAATGHTVVRINLSEQTDISELFGSDMPTEGADGASLFAWRDGPFLSALKNGSWILLDELNLASQSVLEGLNACLDHRGEIFIPELNRTFTVDTRSTRIFACQNPLFQGSGRKGLPKSFLSRFTQVFVEELQDSDLLSICRRAYPTLPESLIATMLRFNHAVQRLITQRRIGTDGQPWELNLRDVMRWCHLESFHSHEIPLPEKESLFLDLLYVSRFRSEEDRRIVTQLAESMGLISSGTALPRGFLKTELRKDAFVVGRMRLLRTNRTGQRELEKQFGHLQLLQSQSGVLEKLALCINQSFPVILAGPQGSAKSSLVQVLAAVTGHPLEVVSMNSDTDAGDLLGGFEQNNWQRDAGKAVQAVTDLCDCIFSFGAPDLFSRVRLLQDSLPDLSAALSSLEDTAPARTLALLKPVFEELTRLSVAHPGIKEIHQRTVSACHRAIFSLESTKKGRFEWCDSLVVKALLEGSWLLIDNANLCSPAVLDRLNSVLEPQGELFVPERGDAAAAVIRGHPNFRLFMTTNPKYGELSRAMRNRGIEIFVPATLHDRDCLAVLTRLGLSYDVALILLNFLHKVTPLKAFSLEDVQGLGKEVWMRLAENADLSEALRKAVRNSSSFPEGCEVIVDQLQLTPAISSICPYPVTVLNLLQQRVLTNVSRHQNGLLTVVHHMADILQRVITEWRLVMDLPRWNVYLLSMAKGLFFSLLTLEEREMRLQVLVEFEDGAVTPVDKHWLSRLQQLLVATEDFHLVESGHTLIASWLRACFDWDALLSSLRDQYGRGSDMSVDLERLTEFFEHFASWMVVMLMDGKTGWFRINQQTALKIALASLTFRSLMAVLDAKASGRLTSPGFASVVWRLFSQHVLDCLDLSGLDGLPVIIASQIRTFDEDFCTRQDEQRIVIRGALVEATPFTTDEQYRSYNALLTNLASEVVKVLPIEEVLTRLADRARHLGSTLGSDLVLRVGSSNEVAENARFWRLIQSEFALCEMEGQELLSVVLKVAPYWTAFPVILKELLLVARKPGQVLTPLEVFSLKFELLSTVSDSDDVAATIVGTSPDYLWWKEVLQLMSTKGHSWSAKLGNFGAQMAISRRVEAHLWRKIHSPLDSSRVLESHLNAIASFLTKGLLSVQSVPLADRQNVNGRLGSSLAQWKELLISLPSVDPRFDVLERTALDLLTESGEDPSATASSRHTHSFWLTTGIVTMKALSPLFLDPVQEQQTTREWLQYQAVDCDTSLRMTTLYFTTLYGSGGQENFDEQITLPYQQRLEYVQSALDKKEMRTVMFRPEPSMYHALVQDSKGLQEITLRRVIDLLQVVLADSTTGKVRLLECAGHLASLIAIAADLRRKYFAYQDMAAPFLSGVHQVLFGFAGLLRSHQRDLLKTELGPSSSSGHLLAALTGFFGVNETQPTSYLQAARGIWRRRKFILGLYRSRPEDRLVLEIRLILLVLQLLRLHGALFHTRESGPSAVLRNSVFMRFAVIWHDIEQVKKKAEEEKLQLYKFAADEITQARDTAFPSFEQDLANLSAEMQATELPSQTTAEHRRFFEEIQHKIVTLHGQILSATSKAAPIAESGNVASVGTVVTLAVDIGCELITSYPEVCDFDIDATGFLLQSRISRAAVETCSTPEKNATNFYHDSNITEAKTCVSIIRSVHLRVEELLVEWPGQPVLCEITVIIERLLSFQLTEPLAKLLMALELVMEKCEKWEVNASSQVSLQREMEVLGEVIVRWRKLELQQWHNALDHVVRERAGKATKWWLLLFTTVAEAVSGGDAVGTSVDTLVQVLQRFVETSSLGEFRVRLELLRTVSLHFAASPGSTNTTKTKEICTVLRNVHAFYSQFTPSVETSIAQQRKSIEKELKEFVKVARWMDMNYHALKATIHKAHRTVHSGMRKLEAVLDQKVILQRTIEGAPTPSPQLHHRIYLGALPLFPPSPCLPKMTELVVYVRKCRKITRQAVYALDYIKALSSLNEISLEYFDRFSELKEPPCDLTLTGEKRKAASKTVIKSKRLAFTDLTKTLKEMGLSSRKGLVLPSATVASVAAFNAQFPSRSLGDWLGGLAEKCQDMYWSNVSNLAVFRRLLESPCKTLDARFVAVMKGFAEHLHHLILQQIEVSSSLTNFSASLHAHLESSTSRPLNHQSWTQSTYEETAVAVPGVLVRSFLSRACDFLRDMSVTLEKHLVLLDAAPSCTNDGEQFVNVEGILTVLHGPCEELFQGDARWTALRTAVSTYRNTVLQKLNELTSSDQIESLLHLIGQKERGQVRDVINFFASSRPTLLQILELSLPASRTSVSGILEQLELFTREWNATTLAVGEVEGGKIPALTERVLEACLRGFQTVKVHLKSREDRMPTGEEGYRAVFDLGDGCLRSGYGALNADKITRTIHLLVRQCNQLPATGIADQCLQISRGFLETFVVLVSSMEVFAYRLVESSNLLLRVLLTVFTDILENGFGKVDEIEEDSKEQNSHEKFEESEQAGLGDGQGAKDVSEQIESEDQLEDTKTPGKEEEEKKSEEKIENEEHGVEMTEDFEGAMDDAPTEELGSDDEEESDEPEVDDQMGSLDGDNDDTAENLDKQFWEGDDEDENDPEEDEADEKKESADGQGVDEREKIDLAPKDDSIDDSTAQKNDEAVDEKENRTDAGEMGDEENNEQVGEAPDLDLPEKMDFDDEEFGEEEPVPEEDALSEEKPEDDTDLPETAEDDEMAEAEATKQEDSNVPELPEEDALKASSSVPPTEKNDSDVGTDGAGMPAEMDTDQNPDMSQQNNDDAYNSDTTGKSEAASGRKTNDDAGRDVDSRLPQQQDPARKKPQGVEKRSLEPVTEKKTPGNKNESYRKRLKISQAQNQRTVEKQEKDANKNQTLADMYEHVASDTDQFDDQVVDAASKDEAKEQNPDRSQMDDEDEEDAAVEDDNMNVDEDPGLDEKTEEATENPPIVLKSKKEQVAQKKESQKKNSQQAALLDAPGDLIPTLGALEENSTFHGFQADLLESLVPQLVDVDALRRELVQEMANWSGRQFDSTEHENLAMSTWRKYEAITQSLSHELCEQLRLVLEPTKKSKLRGDYRTGKRLNMRKVVAYVASDFRKDKIWLRRTMPSQRQYQVLIAVDDSSSMADNQTKELAFESLAVLSNALTVLEVGELSICSFGQGVEILHPFQLPFSSSDGARVLTKFTFGQNRTNVAEMVNLVTGVFDESRSRLLNVTNVSQLLLIVSDGRGIFGEGASVVKQAVRRLVNMGVFTVFVILDNPSESHTQRSVLDIRTVVGSGESMEMRSYMQDFPFPFYLILRNVKDLPCTLCDALRQWFEMISSRD